MFSKRIADLTKEDIQRVCAEAFQEGPEVEFKADLPTRDGKPDPWLGGGSVSDRARNEILEEVIAFANAFGGTLIIGIAETEDKPSRAKEINPLPRCADLAERLRLQCRDCIEPQIPIIEASGVSTETDGSGVVVIRVPRSRMAPHRLKDTRHCYVRRADRSEKMTMREIQDLTLQIDRGLAALESKFSKDAELFAQTIASIVPNWLPVFGARAILLPITPIALEHVHDDVAAQPPSERFSATLSGGTKVDLVMPTEESRWRPGIRSTHNRAEHPSGFIDRSAYCDGQIRYVFVSKGKRDSDEPFHIYPGWFLSLVCNAICAAERFRRRAGAPEVEYGLELEIRARTVIDVPGYAKMDFDLYTLSPGSHEFPRYSVGAPATFQNLVSRIERDFWNACGHDRSHFATIDFDGAFRRLRLPQFGAV